MPLSPSLPDSSPLPFLDTLSRDFVVQQLADALDDARGVLVRGSRGSSTTVLAGLMAALRKQDTLLVVGHLDEADHAIDDLLALQQGGLAIDPLLFPALEVLPGESTPQSEWLAQRQFVMHKMHHNNTPTPRVMVAPAQALMQPVLPEQIHQQQSLTICAGAQFDPRELTRWLESAGYIADSVIQKPGDYALRGGLLDIWPIHAAAFDHTAQACPCPPLRLDFFGNDLERVLALNPNTLRPESAQLAPPHVLIMRDGVQDQIAHPKSTPPLALLSPGLAVVLHERSEIIDQTRGYYERLNSPINIMAPGLMLSKLCERPHLECNQFSAGGGQREQITLPVAPLPAFSSQVTQAIEELRDLEQDYSLYLLAQQGDLKRAEELVCNIGTHHLGHLSRGFLWTGQTPLGILPWHEIVHRYDTHIRGLRKHTPSIAGINATDAFLDLEPGDLCVHLEHGIARYKGLSSQICHGRSEEYLTLEFAQDAVLHVPIHHSDLVQKYIGGTGRPPSLSTLGGQRWRNAREAATKAARGLAAELLRVQVARNASPGTAFPPDTMWMQSFEAAFPFEETEDQSHAIASVKRDMEHSRPMDRLLCGDVGFGKTEVAIRAAFKSAEAGRQVAILVPTTVLAEQHERSFRERFSGYPFRVESISRFKSDSEARIILQDTAQGKVDVLIGTHRILSEDVEFKDLGLVVIDEEQRFGVEHKQKLLSLRVHADVFSMSATPIPRTLHMSMVGLRDISSLTTAPLNRHAVVTEVVPESDEVISRALQRELAREGQAYFVHNRVHDIHTVADRIRALAPAGAKVIVGHGQMTPRELEEVMLSFTRHEADILVSTTIIESGIDIPNANTMFIHDAHRFGLAQLHQLRGRVGRWKHRAYCYMLTPSDHQLSDTAHKRLAAIEQYSMLGAGFKIAMQDLEIRGAGNLLGREQSGHIAAVGYELYCMLLERETKRLRGEVVLDVHATTLDIPAEGHLPSHWIPSDRHRLAAYRRLTRCGSLTQLDKLCEALEDTWGELPPPAQTFINRLEIRMAAASLGIGRMELKKPDMILQLINSKDNTPEPISSLPGRVTRADEQDIYWRPPSERYFETNDTLLAVLRKALVQPLRQQEKITRA